MGLLWSRNITLYDLTGTNCCLGVVLICHSNNRGGVRYMAERRKRTKKVAKSGKSQNNLRKTGKGKSDGNRKRPFSSHEKPENFKIL